MLTFLRRRPPGHTRQCFHLRSPRHARARARSIPHPRPELLGLLALAALLNLWALSRNGWANEYYSAAVRSN
jgi:hypothetical protein